MPIKFRCPHCEQFLGISENQADAVTDCPTCGRTIRVPGLDGKVRPLPAPRLNLHDEELRAALGMLAAVGQDPAEATIPDPSAPEAVRTVAESQPEIIGTAGERTILEPVVLPHVTDASEFSPEPAASHEEVLSQLAASSSRSPLEKFPAREGLRFGPAVLFLSACFCLAAGLLIGSALKTGEIPEPVEKTAQKQAVAQAAAAHPVVPAPAIPQASEPPLAADVQGDITYSGSVGTAANPDIGARVLILPLQRKGTAKLPNQAFRVGADEVDQELLAAAAKVLGGDFQVADLHGHYKVRLPAQERFGLLIASRYQPRSNPEVLTDRCRNFLATYFDQPDRVIGNVEYRFEELNLEATPHKECDVEFTAP